MPELGAQYGTLKLRLSIKAAVHPESGEETGLRLCHLCCSYLRPLDYSLLSRISTLELQIFLSGEILPFKRIQLCISLIK